MNDLNLNTEPGQRYATVTWDVPTATDNSGNVPTVIASHVPPIQLEIGTYTVEYTARDADGNEARLSFTIAITG